MKANGLLILIISAALFPFSLQGQTNTFPSSGNAGIGTVTPQAPLHLQSAGPVIRLDGNGGLNATVGDIFFRLNEGYDFASMKAVQSGPSYGYQSALTFFTRNTYEAGLLERMRINYNGWIGIGTVDPQALLHIKSPAPVLKLEGEGGSNAVGNIAFRLAEGYDFANIKAVQVGASYGYQSALTFSTKNLEINGVEERMRVNYDGNVGIGTAVPSEKLSVNGNIRAKKIIVTQAGWPDFVFHDSYRLTPLPELARFIKNNKHLPGIPSAKDVEENGVSLGENQALLLKKIEELTIYVIELKEQNDRQQNQIDQLRREQSQYTTKKMKARIR